MRDSGDVFRVLRWGLRRYAWIVVTAVLALGVLVPRLLDRAPDEFEAQAQVGPTEPLRLPNLDSLPRIGETVFNNGAVAEAVRQSATNPLPPWEDVIPERVELVAAQDNIVFTVVGRGPTAQAAERVANVAAVAFANELNKYARPVGSFALQRPATPPAAPVPQVFDGPVSLVLGIAAGLTVGLGLVTLLLVWRRPIVDVNSAAGAVDAPVLGRVLLTNLHHGTQGLPQLCHRILAGAADTLLIAGPPSTRRERLLLAAEVSRVMARRRRELTIIEEPSQLEIATRPATSMTLLVVPEGIPEASLHRQAEQYLDDGPRGIVLVRGGSGWRFSPWRRLSRRARRADRAKGPQAMPGEGAAA